MEEHCNHRYDGKKCIKCGKQMPGSERKMPKYVQEKLYREITGKLFGMALLQMLRGDKRK